MSSYEYRCASLGDIMMCECDSLAHFGTCITLEFTVFRWGNLSVKIGKSKTLPRSSICIIYHCHIHYLAIFKSSRIGRLNLLCLNKCSCFLTISYHTFFRILSKIVILLTMTFIGIDDSVYSVSRFLILTLLKTVMYHCSENVAKGMFIPLFACTKVCLLIHFFKIFVLFPNDFL